MILVKLFLLYMVIWLLFETFVPRGDVSTLAKLGVLILLGGWMVRSEMKKGSLAKAKAKGENSLPPGDSGLSQADTSQLPTEAGKSASRTHGGATMDASQYEISIGYFSPLGDSFAPVTDEGLSYAVAQAAEYNGIPVTEVERQLETGRVVAWCRSPNYEYDQGVGVIRRKRAWQQPRSVFCDCGHFVIREQVMNASRGTSCVDCYDRMND